MTPDAYFPEEMLDETMPPDRESPDAWIIDGPSGEPALDLSAFGDDDRRPLHDGDIVRFASRTDHGAATLTLREDGYSTDAMAELNAARAEAMKERKAG